MGIAALTAELVGRGWHPGALLFGVLIPLVIVGLIAYGIWELVRPRDAGPVAGAGASNQALAVLDERFARGDVDAEEYVQRRNLLMSPIAAAGSPSDRVQPPAPPPESVDTSEQPAGPAGTTEQPTQ